MLGADHGGYTSGSRLSPRLCARGARRKANDGASVASWVDLPATANRLRMSKALGGPSLRCAMCVGTRSGVDSVRFHVLISQEIGIARFRDLPRLTEQSQGTSGLLRFSRSCKVRVGDGQGRWRSSPIRCLRPWRSRKADITDLFHESELALIAKLGEYQGDRGGRPSGRSLTGWLLPLRSCKFCCMRTGTSGRDEP